MFVCFLDWIQTLLAQPVACIQQMQRKMWTIPIRLEIMLPRIMAPLARLQLVPVSGNVNMNFSFNLYVFY